MARRTASRDVADGGVFAVVGYLTTLAVGVVVTFFAVVVPYADYYGVTGGVRAAVQQGTPGPVPGFVTPSGWECIRYGDSEYVICRRAATGELTLMQGDQ